MACSEKQGQKYKENMVVPNFSFVVRPCFVNFPPRRHPKAGAWLAVGCRLAESSVRALPGAGRNENESLCHAMGNALNLNRLCFVLIFKLKTHNF
mgnify:CR=1